ncbi:MAG: hypothetical protein ACKUBY_05855 [Candidatus Moraniibacteriota bacterium]|jgi:EPTP domain-containing protein
MKKYILLFPITLIVILFLTQTTQAAITDIQIDGGSSDSIDENTPSGTTSGTLTTTGGNSPYTYELINGIGDEDNSKFTIDGDNLNLNFTPDYENPEDLGGTPGDNNYSTRVKTTDSYSDFVLEQGILTNGAQDLEYFTIGTDDYLVVANYHNNSTYNINSKIYKWNGTSFVDFQSIATSGASDWEHFTIGTDDYLAVTNYYNGSTYNISSKIYKWNGTSFGVLQSIATNGARNWEHFRIGIDDYLAVTNYYNGSSRNINSKIYKWNGTSFVEFQSIATTGANSWEYFTIGTDNYLALANSYSGSYNINSKIYKWNGTSFVDFQSIATSGASGWKHFTIGVDDYLVVANYSNGSTNINSKIYKWNGTSFVEFQSIATNGASDWEYFTIDTEHYLVVANNYNGSTYNINSKIYKWNGSTFVEFQSIATSGATSWEYFMIGMENYLVVTNFYNDATKNINSNIYKSLQEQFEKQIIISVDDVVEEVIITDPNNSEMQQSVDNGYITVDNGTIDNTTQTTTQVQVTFQSNTTNAIFPNNTVITESLNGNFNFENFITENTLTSEQVNLPNAVGAVRIGVPGISLDFTNDITMEITVSEAYNGMILDVLSREEGAAQGTEVLHTTCTVTNGICTFTTNHATTYIVNGDGTISGIDDLNLNVEVNATLSMDCYDKDGVTGDYDVILGTIANPGIVIAGTPAVGQSTCIVTTNDTQGYYLSMINDNGASNTTLVHSNNTDEIPDLTQFNETTKVTESWNAPTTKGLGFSVIQFPQADTTNNTFNNVWTTSGNLCEEGTTSDDAQYAGVPQTAQAVAAHTAYNSTSSTTDVCYKVDVSPSQPSGIYTGSVTYTATSDASGFYQ